jgi:hypothetical protein
MYQWPEMADEGGFAAYGPRFTYVRVLAAQLMVRREGGRNSTIASAENDERSIHTASRRPFVISPNALLHIPELRSPENQNEIQSHLRPIAAYPQTERTRRGQFPSPPPSLTVRQLNISANSRHGTGSVGASSCQ